MNPYVSWAIVLVVTGGLGYYYSNTGKPRGRTPLRTAPEKAEAAAPASKQRKPKVRKSPEPTSTAARKTDEKPPTSALPAYAADDEEDVDDREFAKQLAAARTGVAVGEAKAKPRKEKRAKAANPIESAGSEFSTGAPSSNGADADDDSSSTDHVVVSADDVSDMLEKPAPGASVLRLTGSLESKEKKPKAQAFKAVESKKQRQNRQKNETRKQANQDAEAERRKLLEKQLHTAREAERQEAARKKPAAVLENAWNSVNKVNGSNAATPASSASLPLLDTFEPASSSGPWTSTLPPEEEQMRILGVSQSEEDWTTVPSKKEKTKKKAKTDDSATEASVSEAAAVEVESKPTEWVAPQITPVPIPRGKNHPLDSDWAA